MSPRAVAGAGAPSPSSKHRPLVGALLTCSDDENFAVYGGASTSEPDTEELMDGRGRACGPGPGARPAVVQFHAGAAAAAAGGIGTGADDLWLFEVRRPTSRTDDDRRDADVRDAVHHPGCSGVAAYAVATTTRTTAAASGRSEVAQARTALAAAAAAFAGRATGSRTAAMAPMAMAPMAMAPGGASAAVVDAIDDLLSDFKGRQQQQQQRQKQQREDADVDADDARHLSTERVSLASLGGGPRVSFRNTLPAPVAVADEAFGDGQARFAPAHQAPPPAAPPLPSRPAPWAPARPRQATTAVFGPSASAAYEEEALSFSRSRKRCVESSAATFRHPGM